MKILLVDDSASSRSVLRYMLESIQLTTCEAGDGESALMQLHSQADIALVFLDVNMPVLDGLSCAELIRAEVDAGRLRDVPVVMLTTEAKRELVLRGKRAGVKGWLIKPPNKADVVAVTQKVLGLRAKNG